MICSQSGKSPHLCRSIPTGVDPPKIRASEPEIKLFRQQIEVTPDEFLVGTACFMRSWKGVDDLLRAADLLRDVPGLKWVIIGGGHAERHKELARQLKLDQIVRFTGHLDNPFPGLAALDVFALLSTANEGVSQAILQAAYFGKPLIATRVGGLGEVCRDRITGLNVSSHSPAAVAHAVLELKEQALLRSQFGARARQLVLEQFTLAHTLDQMEMAYRFVSES
jgi:glycosyltransferase involved in cell wall biosynthesis